VRVSDVAEVTPSVSDRYIRTTARGRPAVLVNVMKQPTGSTVKIGGDVINALAALKLPPGVRFENWYDQSSFIESSIHSTRDSIIVGIVLAMVVLLVFLRSWRVAIVIAVVVPVTIASTIVCLVGGGKDDKHHDAGGDRGRGGADH